MKYIRTEYNIWEVVEETEIIYRVKSKSDPHNIYSKSKCQTDVIKSADTIEELCDEFVVYTPNMYSNMKVYLRYEFESKLDSAIQDYANYKDLNEEVYVYGAIWTDKGLIYVAKMNDKGELELL